MAFVPCELSVDYESFPVSYSSAIQLVTLASSHGTTGSPQSEKRRDTQAPCGKLSVLENVYCSFN